MEHASLDRVDHWLPGTRDSEFGNSPYQKEVKFWNFMDVDAYLATREGLKFKQERIVRTPSPFDGIIVQVRLNFSPGVRKDIERQMTLHDLENSKELQTIQDAWSKPNAYPLHRDHRGLLEYKISRDFIAKHGGTVYIREIDHVVSIDPKATLYHPNSTEGTLRHHAEHLLGSTPSLKSANFIYAVKVIDNKGNFGKRWIKIGSDVCVIVPIDSEGEEDGIYVTTTRPVDNQLMTSKTFVEKFDLDKEKEVPYFILHRSYQEARAEDFNEQARKIELMEKEIDAKNREVEAKILAADNALRKAEADKDTAEQKRAMDAERYQHDRERFAHEKATLQQEIEKIKQERISDQQKLKSEKSMLFRKSLADMLKSIPSLILGVLGLIAALAKLKTA